MEEEAEHPAPRHLRCRIRKPESRETSSGVTRKMAEVLVAGHQSDVMVETRLRYEGIRHTRGVVN
jgi:hypothetical protein